MSLFLHLITLHLLLCSGVALPFTNPIIHSVFITPPHHHGLVARIDFTHLQFKVPAEHRIHSVLQCNSRYFKFSQSLNFIDACFSFPKFYQSEQSTLLASFLPIGSVNDSSVFVVVGYQGDGHNISHLHMSDVSHCKLITMAGEIQQDGPSEIWPPSNNPIDEKELIKRVLAFQHVTTESNIPAFIQILEKPIRTPLEDMDHITFFSSEKTDIGLPQSLHDEMDESSQKFLRSSSQVTTLIQSGISSREVFAVAIDPVINHAPVVIAMLIIQLIAQPIIQIVFECLLPSLTAYFVPLGSIGMMLPIPNIPSPDVSLSANINVGASFSTFFQAMPGEEEKINVVKAVKKAFTSNVLNHMLSHDLPEAADILYSKLGTSLRIHIHRILTRSLSRSLTTNLTQVLSDALINSLQHSLVPSLDAEENYLLVKSLTYSLSHSLTNVIVSSLTHRPRDDFYCHYCRIHQTYCDFCKQSLERQYHQDYYSTYYLRYYLRWWDSFYSTVNATQTP